MTDLRKAAEMAAADLEELIHWHGIRDSNDKLMPAHNQTPEIKSAIETLETLRQALAQPEQEPVAWSITERNINSLQVDSINSLIGRAKHAHMIDVKVRVNGQDEWYEADWLKHLKQTAPPKREFVGLTGNEARDFYEKYTDREELIHAIDKFLEEKNNG